MRDSPYLLRYDELTPAQQEQAKVLHPKTYRQFFYQIENDCVVYSYKWTAEAVPCP